MKERRTLRDGLNPTVDRSLEEQFVFAKKATAEPVESRAPSLVEPEARDVKAAANPPSRAPLTTRIRADYASALKRASLQRQLEGVFPQTLQEILEEALEPWLKTHGYLG